MTRPRPVNELVDYFEPEELLDAPPGVYAAASDTDAFGPMLAAIDLGYVKDLGQHIETKGVRIQAVEVGRASNPSIGISRELFSGVLKKYSQWRIKWWREAIQNSVDAGATTINCGVVENPDGTRTVWIEDNGSGMERDVLLEKFLNIGGSTKVGVSGMSAGIGVPAWYAA